MVKTEANIRKSYSLYRKTVENPINDLKKYINIANEYNKFLFEKVLDGEEITLPGKMGTMYIIGTKQKITFNEEGKPILPIDWVKTFQLRKNNPIAKEEKKVIYQLNQHTNGVRYKIHWSKRRILVENKTLFSLRMTRTNKRAINKAIEQGKEYLIKA